MEGGAGNDTFVFHRGEANSDTVFDFGGNGAATGDSLRFSGYGTTDAGATFIQVDSTHWTINSSDGVAHDTVMFTNAASIDVTDWLFV